MSACDALLVMHCLDNSLLPLKGLVMVLVQQCITVQLAALTHALLSDTCVRYMCLFSNYLTNAAMLDGYCFNMFRVY